VLIPTGSFSRDAIEFVKYIERRIVLIDGLLLAGHLIDHNVGVTTARSFVVKKFDLGYFEEELG
jgi:restriction system protein